ncbi:dihydrofolate reductase [Pseudomonas phage phiK7B1]|nr:dihydrofolate reductase [Pseudomonas phage phiK7B1]
MTLRKRQIAVSMNQNGVIGIEDKLLFSAAADLAKFAKFTDGTSLIVGRLTAQQMVNFNMRIKERRPLIVISESGVLKDTTSDDEKWIYYVKNLQAALIQAEVLAIDLNLNGYTIAGGKRVYDDYMDLIDAGKVRPNAAYLFSHEMGPVVPALALKRDFNQVRVLLEARMINPSYVWHEADVLGKDSAGNPVRTVNGRFGYIHDKAEIDPSVVRKVGTQLRVDTDGGEVCLDLYGIVGWSRKQALESVEVRLSGGESITVRPRSHAGLNSLLFALNMTAFN